MRFCYEHPLTQVPRRMGLVTNLVPLSRQRTPPSKSFSQARHSWWQLAARPRFRRSSPTSPPQFRMGRIKLWRGGNAFRQGFPSWTNRASASPRYSTFFCSVLACYVIIAHIFCALSVGQAWRASPLRSGFNSSCS